MRRFYRLCLGIFLVGLCWLCLPASLSSAVHAVELPPRFVVRTVVSGMTLPTDMVILPSGDFLVTEKGSGSGPFSKAQVRLVRDGILRPEPVLTLGVNSEADSGLYSIVLDPQFSLNGYIYLWYSTGEDSLGWQEATYNRLSRFVYDAVSGTASASSETIIVDNIPWSPLHNGGGVIFDTQGNLLVATGDAGSDYNFPATHLSQNLTSLNGKVLRIRPSAQGGYEVPGDNPLVGSGTGARPEIYAWGLRNPFRFTRRLSDQSFYLLDVGQETWEEVNRLTPASNYGWPYREGKCPIFDISPDCPPAPVEYTDPLLVYPHPYLMGSGVTAMAFYEGSAWPKSYQGKLFFADFDLNWIGMIDVDDADQPFTQFAADFDSIVDMQATAEGLYLVSIYDGDIKFIYYDESSNRPPTAKLQVTPVSGSAPLTVQFSAEGSFDSDGDSIVYDWDFGDGSELVTTREPTVEHVYQQDGDYLATLQVTDRNGGQSEIRNQLIQVFSGVYATILQENLVEPGRSLYQGGDRFLFRATREGDISGLDPASPYSWRILQHHNDHVHVVLNGYAAGEVDLEIPTEPHALGSPIWYEIILYMHTPSGQAIPISHELRPQTAWLQTSSWPGPAVITLNQRLQPLNQPSLIIVGQKYVLEAAESIIYDSKIGQFRHWVVTDGWPVASAAGEPEIVTERSLELIASAESKSYVAFYEYVQPAVPSYLPAVAK